MNNTNNFQISSGAILVLASFGIAFIIGKWFPIYWSDWIPFIISAFSLGVASLIKGMGFHWGIALALLAVGLVAAACGFLQTMPELSTQ
ncbi:MAG: hypothetical protein O2909_06880 [Chloroflexi bacterium]|nr:hypothetical protein [Chloroflexota bacterium]MDA1219147.1 hypothetical protein [Chloroflexota bacterium]